MQLYDVVMYTKGCTIIQIWKMKPTKLFPKRKEKENKQKHNKTKKAKQNKNSGFHGFRITQTKFVSDRPMAYIFIRFKTCN